MTTPATTHDMEPILAQILTYLGTRPEGATGYDVVDALDVDPDFIWLALGWLRADHKIAITRDHYDLRQTRFALVGAA